MSDVERFLARFQRFGAAPRVESYVALFDPDATLFDSGMPRPLTVPEIPEHIAGILKLVPDFRMTPERWRFREPTIFVEAHNRATLAGAPIGKAAPAVPVAFAALRIGAADCIDLAAGRVAHAALYVDTLAFPAS